MNESLNTKEELKTSNKQQIKRIGNHSILLNKLLGKGHYGKVYIAFNGG